MSIRLFLYANSRTNAIASKMVEIVIYELPALVIEAKRIRALIRGVKPHFNISLGCGRAMISITSEQLTIEIF